MTFTQEGSWKPAWDPHCMASSRIASVNAFWPRGLLICRAIAACMFVTEPSDYQGSHILLFAMLHAESAGLSLVVLHGYCMHSSFPSHFDSI